MAAMQTHNSSLSLRRVADRCIDVILTLVYWAWFIFGFLLFFSWRYLAAALFAKDPQRHFQRLNSRFYQIFFRIVRRTAPRQVMRIDEQAAAIRSAVIVCNHLSYLDPLLFIALFQQQKTIVKTRFFSMPIFGTIIKKSGYFPATGEGKFAEMMVRQMETMATYLQGGGNLFVFPEGTRSRDGKLAPLHKGAFKIARLCKAPLYVLHISNTDKLFTPGKFLFNTRQDNIINVKIIDRIEPDYEHNPPSTADLERRVHEAYSGSVI
jgi:1-acyl-sn-glycerol-3-phosphate acyltransferase